MNLSSVLQIGRTFSYFLSSMWNVGSASCSCTDFPFIIIIFLLKVCVCVTSFLHLGQCEFLAHERLVFAKLYKQQKSPELPGSGLLIQPSDGC